MTSLLRKSRRIRLSRPFAWVCSLLYCHCNSFTPTQHHLTGRVFYISLSVVPITDDPTLPVVTFRFWLLSFLFTALGATIQQYYFFRSTSGAFSIFFVNLVTFSLGKGLARIMPTAKITLFGQDLSLNPGPFNIKEHALIGIAVSTGASAAYAIDILSATDIFLDYRINFLGSMIIIITTQCCGYGMAGLLRKYLVYPAEMVWWSNLVQVVFYNTLHNTDQFQKIRLVRGWSSMKFFWIVVSIVCATLLFFMYVCECV